MSALDLHGLSLVGTQLIEASAGTGKTWTIAGLYLRLLLETGRDISEILVVTFTKAATAELRERLRERIVQVEYALMTGESDDDFCCWALSTFIGEKRAEARERLEKARRRFDEAAIFTIHGFCQRVLTETQMPALLIEPDIVPDERDILPLLVQEAWIRHCQDDLLADLLQEEGISIAVVIADVQALLRKPYLALRGGEDEQILMRLHAGRKDLLEQWQQKGEEIRDDLRRADGISQSKDAYKDVEGLLRDLQHWLEGDGALTDGIRSLTHSKFQASSSRKKNGHKPVHAFWKNLEAWLDDSVLLARQFRRTLIADVQAALHKQKQMQGLLTYQDLLSLLSDAVTETAVAASIRKRYSAALIDEFQDTDPLQFRIFDRVYNHYPETEERPPLFLVGDPKQAIYSFRGADIFTYLRARESAAARHTLDTNRRSQFDLVQAVNSVFSQNTNAFLLSDLRFQNVRALEVDIAPVFVDGKRALHCDLLPDDQGKPLTKERAGKLSAEATAEQIVGLLQGAAAGQVKIPDEDMPGNLRPLTPPDIAVLVPTHRHGRLMVDALTARGVAVVQRSEESVFATQEAVEFHRVLEAVIAPGREGLVKAALLGTLLGGSPEMLYAAQNDDVRWSELIETLLSLREHWQRQGFMAMWEALLTEFSIFDRLLKLSSGERRLTNLRHLATLMQHQADGEPMPERQLAWLREQLEAGEKNDNNQLRLESDAARVQILTVHVSKGLEYPVVFCPFLWNANARRSEERAEYRRGADSLLDIGSVDFALAQERMGAERQAEQLRVLYVALTRAKYRCQIVWGRVKDSEMAALTWLLLGQGVVPEPEEIRSALQDRDRSEYVAALDNLKKACANGFSWSTLTEPDFTAYSSGERRERLLAPVLPSFHRSLQRRWRVSSFTGLSETAHEFEAPDYDAQQPEAVSTEIVPQGIHAFPRGAQAGVFWHELLEDLVMNRVGDRHRFVADTLRKFAIDESWQPLVEKTLTQWLETPLHEENMVLSRLQARMAEMEFVYPARNLRPAAFLNLPDVPALYREALVQLDFATLNGYLKGFMDLVCRHQGRYYVIDYKTNWLGSDAAAYTRESLERAVAGSHYYLQYWLYVLALHRHLRVALKQKYDYERDIGGVRYLFLRGIDADTQGVYARKPSRALIEALDRLMEGRP